MVLCENPLEKNCYSSAFLNRGLLLIGIQHEVSRTQYFEVENVKSNPLSIQCGVPQCSTRSTFVFDISK